MRVWAGRRISLGAAGAVAALVAASCGGEDSAVASEYLGTGDDTVALIRWTESDGSLSGNVTLVGLSGPDDDETSSDTYPLTGIYNGDQVSVTIDADGDTGTYTGTLERDVLRLDVPDRDGRFLPSSFSASNADDYEAAIEDLEAAAGDNRKAANERAQAARQREAEEQQRQHEAEERARDEAQQREAEWFEWASTAGIDAPVLGGRWSVWERERGIGGTSGGSADFPRRSGADFAPCNTDVSGQFTGYAHGGPQSVGGGDGIVYWIIGRKCDRSTYGPGELDAIARELLPSDAVEGTSVDGDRSFTSAQLSQVCGAGATAVLEDRGNAFFLEVSPCTNK